MLGARRLEAVLLAIDTSAGTSVALLGTDGAVLAERDEPSPRGHAESIGLLLAGAFADADAAPAAVTHVVAGLGPGTFTGLRVGIAAARAFALGVGVPVLGLASHFALVADRTEATLVVTDARRRELAWSAFDGVDDDGIPVLIAGPALAPSEELDAVVAAELGPDTTRFQRLDAASVPAAGLGRIAARRLAAGLPAGDAPDAIYLRAPDVTLSSGPKRVTA